MRSPPDPPDAERSAPAETDRPDETDSNQLRELDGIGPASRPAGLLEQRCADGRPCEHVVVLTDAGQVAVHVMGYPEHGERLLEHARWLAEQHGYGVEQGDDE